jgi:hypothetical protein
MAASLALLDFMTALAKRDWRSVRGLSLPKMLSGANAFEISDIEKMNIGAHQPGV